MKSTSHPTTLLVLLALLAGMFAADALGIFAGIDTALYDLSFRLRGPKAVSDRIIIAAVDEKTLARHGRWPIPRSVYVQLLSAMDGASVIGFDVVLSEPSPDDALLARAIRQHGRVVLPIYLDTSLQVTSPAPSFSFAPTGHVHAEMEVDHVTRSIFHSLATSNRQFPSLTSAMYSMATGSPVSGSAAPSAFPAQKTVRQQEQHTIDFYGPPGTFPHLSVADIVAGHWPRNYFRDKIVLLGLTTPGVVDGVMTPFSEERNNMSGVELHANILNNLLEDRRVRPAPDWLRLVAAALICLLTWLVFSRVSEIKAFAICMACMMLMTVIIFSLFVGAEIWLAPSLIHASLGVTFIVSHLRRLDDAARKLENEHHAIAALIDGSNDQPAGKARGGLAGFITLEGITLKIDRLVGIQKRYAENLQAAVTSRTAQLEQALATIGSMSDEMVLRLAWAVESKDKETGEHTFRLGLYARVLGKKLGLPSEFVEDIVFASALHDVGKIGISDSILLKKGPLNREEMETIKTHCLIGQRILDHSTFPKIQLCASIALNHHERWDGTGYPNGLQGEEIPLEARIVAICDCYDSLRSRRPYKESYDHETAVRIMTEGTSRTRPTHFDPKVLQAFREEAPILAEIFRQHQD